MSKSTIDIDGGDKIVSVKFNVPIKLSRNGELYAPLKLEDTALFQRNCLNEDKVFMPDLITMEMTDPETTVNLAPGRKPVKMKLSDARPYLEARVKYNGLRARKAVTYKGDLNLYKDYPVAELVGA